MAKKVLELNKSKIDACNSIIIKDPSYDRSVWCAFQNDNCSSFTHTKGIVSNYNEHYKDEEFEADLNVTEFGFLIGTELFISHFRITPDKNGQLNVYTSAYMSKGTQSDVTEIGCDTAEFSFGNENTFGAFAISTGADGYIGEVHFFTDTGTGEPLGLLFNGSCDGDIVSPEEMYESFIAAFGAEIIKDKSLTSKIVEIKNNKTDSQKENTSQNTSKNELEEKERQ